jgi:chromosome segregation ATPase
MSADKNHEQYLEEIEIAVAQTTKALMEEHNSDLRKLAKVCAEKQLQVKRLKEFQENDRSTIRSLRVKLEQAIEEIECRNSTWETKEGEYEGEIVELKEELDIAHFEYDKLKEEKYSLYLKWSELKEENNKLKGREIERVFGVSEEVFKKLLKECPPDPDDYK